MNERRPTGPVIRVLVVEDCDDHADLTLRALQRCSGYAVRRAASLLEVQTETVNSGFDVVLLDLDLPDSSGLNTVGRVRELAPDAAIVVVTSDDSDLTGRQAVAAGAQDFLPKRELRSAPLDRILRYAIERQQILNTNARLAEDLQASNEALQRATQEAVAAGEARSRFLATMSHEIRTPLAAVLDYADIASETDGVKEDRDAMDALRTVRRNGDHLMALINDILDVAKIDADGMTVESIPMTLSESLSDAVQLFEPQCATKQIELTADLGGGTPDRILGDPLRVRQVLFNLVGNALKFTARGSIRVLARSIGTDASGHTIEVSVADTGIGMDAEQLARIRAGGSFVQADTTHTREFGGTGLGLSISRSLAGLMGGGITIDSRKHEGTTCRFTFIAPAAGAEPADTTQAFIGPTQPLAGLRVLVVDDSCDLRRLLKHRLEQAGATVLEAASGQDAIDRMAGPHGASIELILMDIQMPTMDGIETARRLRAMRVATPILAVSADVGAATQDQHHAAGFVGHHPKPIAHKALIRQIDELRSARLAA